MENGDLMPDSFTKVAEYLERLPSNSRNSRCHESDVVAGESSDLHGASSGSCHSSISGERRKIAERKISVRFPFLVIDIKAVHNERAIVKAYFQATSNNPLKFVSPNLSCISQLAFKVREQAMQSERQRQSLRILRDSAFCDEGENEEDGWQASLELWRKKRTNTASVTEASADSTDSSGFFDTLKATPHVEEFEKLGPIPEEPKTLVPWPRPPPNHLQKIADIRRNEVPTNGIDSCSARETPALRPTTYYKRSREAEWWNNISNSGSGANRQLQGAEKSREESGCLLRIYIDPREITRSRKAAVRLSGYCDTDSASIRLERASPKPEVPSTHLSQSRTAPAGSKTLIDERSKSECEIVRLEQHACGISHNYATPSSAQSTGAEYLSKGEMRAEVTATVGLELFREESVRLNASCIVPTVDTATASLRVQPIRGREITSDNKPLVTASQLREAGALPHRVQFSRDAPGRLEKSTLREGAPPIKGVDRGVSRSTDVHTLEVAYPWSARQTAEFKGGDVTFLGFEVEGALERGVVVNSVSLGSYAALAGLRVGDKLLDINGVPVEGKYLYSVKKMLCEGAEDGRVLTLSVERPRAGTEQQSSMKAGEEYGSPTVRRPLTGRDLHVQKNTGFKSDEKESSPLTLARLQQLGKLSPTAHTYSSSCSSGIGSAVSPAESVSNRTCAYHEDRLVLKVNSNPYEAESLIAREDRGARGSQLESRTTNFNANVVDYRVISMDVKRVPGNLDDFVPEVERDIEKAGHTRRGNTWCRIHSESSRPLSYDVNSPTATLPPKLIRNFDLYNGSPPGRWQFNRIRNCASREDCCDYSTNRHPHVSTRRGEERTQEWSTHLGNNDERKPLACADHRAQRPNGTFHMTPSREYGGLDGAGISRVSYRFYNRHMRELPLLGRDRGTAKESSSPTLESLTGHQNTNEWRRFIAEQKLSSFHCHSEPVEGVKCNTDRLSTEEARSLKPPIAVNGVTRNALLNKHTPAPKHQPASRNTCQKDASFAPVTSARPAESPSIVTISGRHICNHCGTELGNGAAMVVEKLSLFYHLACFRCIVCAVSLGNGQMGTDVRVRGVHLHCQRCFSSGGTRASMYTSRA